MKKDQIKNTHKRIDFKDYSTSIFTTNKNNKIIEILSNKKVIMIMMILALIFTSMITFKVFFCKNRRKASNTSNYKNRRRNSIRKIKKSSCFRIS